MAPCTMVPECIQNAESKTKLFHNMIILSFIQLIHSHFYAESEEGFHLQNPGGLQHSLPLLCAIKYLQKNEFYMTYKDM